MIRLNCLSRRDFPASSPAIGKACLHLLSREQALPGRTWARPRFSYSVPIPMLTRYHVIGQQAGRFFCRAQRKSTAACPTERLRLRGIGPLVIVGRQKHAVPKPQPHSPLLNVSSYSYAVGLWSSGEGSSRHTAAPWRACESSLKRWATC